MLHAKKFIVYSPVLQDWTYEVNVIDSQTPSIAATQHKAIAKLKPTVRMSLVLASFLGFQYFTADDIELFVGDERINKIQQDFKLGLQKHPIAKSLASAERKGYIKRVGSKKYQFTHDAVQQAFQEQLTTEQQQQAIHYAIGMRYAQIMGEDKTKQDSLLFHTTHHLNRAQSLFSDPQDALQLAQINYKACRVAFSKGSYLTALEYAQVARNMLRPRNPWMLPRRNLTLALYNLSCELEYLTGNFDNTQRAYEKIRANCDGGSNPEEMLHSTRVWCQCLRAQGRIDESIDTGCDFLKQFAGNALKKTPNGAQVALHMYRVKRLLKGNHDSILQLPFCRDTTVSETVRLIGVISLYALIAQRRQFFICGFLRILQLTIQNGLTPNSPYALAMYGCVNRMMGNVEESVRFGNLALAVMERVDQLESTARTTTITYAMLMHLKTPLQDCAGPFLRAFDAGMTVGNTEIAMFAASFHSATLFNTGKTPLRHIVMDNEVLDERMREQGDSVSMLTSTCKPYWQAALNLIGGVGASNNPAILSGAAMNENTLLKEGRDSNNSLLLQFIYIVKIQVACYYGHWDKAILKESMRETTKFIKMNLMAIIQEFFGGLLCYELARRGQQRRKHLKEARQYAKAIERYEAIGCPNTLPFHLMLQAEEVLARDGSNMKAFTSAYNKAIAAAGTTFPHIAALAYERVATILHEQQKAGSAGSREIVYYLKGALEGYQTWGADGKVEDVRRKFGMYLAEDY